MKESHEQRLLAQAERIALELKSQRMKRFGRNGEEITMGISMDGVCAITIKWSTIDAMTHAALSDYLVGAMRKGGV